MNRIVARFVAVCALAIISFGVPLSASTCCCQNGAPKCCCGDTCTCCTH